MSKCRPGVDTSFIDSAEMNNATYLYHYNRLINLYISRFKLINAPDTIDKRFLEQCLLLRGDALFFKTAADDLIALPYVQNGTLNIYGEPIHRRPYTDSASIVFEDRSETNSVIVYSNMSKTADIMALRYFAKKLYLIDRAIDVNVSAQRTPVIISCDKNTELSAKQMQAKIEGNQAYIYVDNNSSFGGAFTALQTGAPLIADRLHSLKENTFAEALSNGGIDNVTTFKRERLITDEVNKSQGGTLASRFSSLDARNEGIEKVNRMFGTNMSYEFNAFQDEEFEAAIEKAESEGNINE